MARISGPDRGSLSNTSPALTIGAGHMPDADTYWLSSELDGVGGTNPATAKGHLIKGHDADIALVRLAVSAWDALNGIQFRVELDHGLGFALLEPPIAVEGPFAGEHFTTTDGKVVIKASLGSAALILRVPVEGANKFRFGFTPADAGNKALAALVAGFRLVQSNLYS